MTLFSEMPLPSELQQALVGLKFTNPTDIQKVVIPTALKGRDIMACAETGSGKTAAYAIPMVAHLLENPQKSALILAPTRELAHQIGDFFRELTAFSKNLKATGLVGGSDIRKQMMSLKRKPRIVVATPGRLIDHLKRRSYDLSTTEILVLDEGDRMLDMGFAPQLDEILNYLPKKRQTSLFTATLPDKVKKLASKYLYQPENVNVGRVSLPVASIKQSVIQLTNKEKDHRIVDELNSRKGSVIIFARTKVRTDILAQNLSDLGFSVGLIHGGRTQGQRNKAIQEFRKGRSRILCATDVAARGIDVPQVEHVINFDLPLMKEDYVHRIGRTARNGASGEAVSFVTPNERRAWQELARKYKIEGVDLGGFSQRESKGSSRSAFRSFGDEPLRPSSRQKPMAVRHSNGKPSLRDSYAQGKKRAKFSEPQDNFSSPADRGGRKRFQAEKELNSDSPFGVFAKKKPRRRDFDAPPERTRGSSGRKDQRVESSEENSLNRFFKPKKKGSSSGRSFAKKGAKSSFGRPPGRPSKKSSPKKSSRQGAFR